jgi:hypothetical protein
VRNTVLVVQHEGAPLDELGKTRTLGLGGCGFVSVRSFGVGSVLDLMIATRPIAIQTRARVVYELPREGGDVEIGVEFLELAPEDRTELEALVGGKLEAADG